MPITPYTKPVESTFVNTQPQLPIRSISAAANQLQKRQNVVRDELDELRNTVVKTEPLSQNREVYNQATEEIRNEISRIAEDGELFNKLSRVRQLSRDFADTTQAFQQNQKNVQAALKDLEDTKMPERVKQQYRALINQQAQLQLDDKGRVRTDSVFSGISVGDETDITQFALDRAKNIEDQRVEQGNFQNMGNGLLRRTIQEGVTKDQVASEVLTSLGFAQDPETGELVRGASSGNPEVENYFQNRRQILSAQGLSEEEIQRRFRKKAKRLVAQAQNKYAGVDTSYDFRSAPSGDGNGGSGSGKRVSVTGSVANLPTTDEVSKDHPKYKEIKDRENLILQNMSGMTGGDISDEEIDTYRQVEEFINSRSLMTKKAEDPARNRAVFNPMSPGGGRPASAGTRSVSRKDAIIANLGEEAYDTWKTVQQTKERLVKETSFDSRIIGFSGERQNDRKDAEEYLSQISGETLTSPDLESGDLFGSTESQQINSILKDPENFTFQGITEDGRYAVILDHNNGNQQVRLRMDTPAADPVYRELTNMVAGSPDAPDARVMKKNNELSTYSITSDEFTPVQEGVSLSRNLSGYTAKADGEDVTFENYADRIMSREEINNADITDLQSLAQNISRTRVDGKTAREVGITPRTAPETVMTYLRQKHGVASEGENLPPDMKNFLDKAMQKHVPFESRGEAAIRAQRFNQLQ
jgi:hypothetical protein